MLNRWIYGNWKVPLWDVADDGGGSGGSDPGDDGGQSISFDDFLKDKGNQAEFDKRVAKALETAKSKWDTEKATELENAKLEAEKLAKMTADQKAEHERKKLEKELSDREKAVTARELKAEALSFLAEKGMPAGLAAVLDYTDADKCKASIEAVEKAFQKSVESAVNDKLKGAPPKGGSGGNNTDPNLAGVRKGMGLQ